MTATKATEKVICDIKTVSCPFEEGKPIIWLDDIKNNNKESPKIISGITKGEELKKIKKAILCQMRMEKKMNFIIKL